MDIKAKILEKYRRARDYYDTFLRQNNEQAYRYYNLQEPTKIDKDITEYFQQIVSSDLADVIEHTIADIMPAFSSEAPVKFTPLGENDEVQAQIETQVVNDIFIQQHNGIAQLTTAFKDAFLLRLGLIEIQTYEKQTVSYQTLTEVDDNILTTFLMQAQQEGKTAEVIGISDTDSAIFDAEVRYTEVTKQLNIESFAPDEFLLDPSFEGVDLDDCGFVGRERSLTRSELVELGYAREVIDQLPKYTEKTYLKPNRQRHSDTTEYRDVSDHSTTLINVAFIYINLDEDDDGIAERRRVVLAGNLPDGAIILEDKPCEHQPFAAGMPFLYPHRMYGVSLFDKIKQVQQIKTKVMRQLLTAGERAARGRIGVVTQQVNMKDIQESVFGGIVRVTTPNGVVPIPNEVFPSDVTQLLTLTNKRRQESGGSAVDKANEEILIGGDTAHGLERIMSAMEQLNSFVAKLLAETLVRQLYRKIHYNLRTYFSEPIQTKFGDNWVTATPTQWPVRQHIATAIGLTMGDRLRMAKNYDILVKEYMAMMEKGSVITTEDKLYSLLVAKANALMVPNAHTYYLNPTSPEGQQRTQQKQAAAQQQQQKEEQLALSQYQLMLQIEATRSQGNANVQQLRNQIDALKIKEDRLTDIENLTLKYDELRLKLAELNAKYDQEEINEQVDMQATS